MGKESALRTLELDLPLNQMSFLQDLNSLFSFLSKVNVKRDESRRAKTAQ